jgi:hypothetical protein
MKDKKTVKLKMYEPFRYYRCDTKTYRATGGNNTHIFYKQYFPDLKIEGHTEFKTPHRQVVSLWNF